MAAPGKLIQVFLRLKIKMGILITVCIFLAQLTNKVHNLSKLSTVTNTFSVTYDTQGKK